ncbi:MAG: hypothetical protein Q9217_002745 [Psora testacea]
MPGRPSTRTAAASHLSAKPPTQPLNNSRRSIARPTIAIPQEGPTSTLRSQICNVFSDAQKTTAGHRKLVVHLRKIQEHCVCEPPSSRGNTGQEREQFGEDDFNVEFARCVIRLMGVKKSEGVGDRLVRFIAFFLRHASEKVSTSGTDFENTQLLPETPTSRLTTHILSILFQFLTSKEKTVRYRSTQVVAHIINSLDSIDDEYYHLLKTGLLKRLRDKEPMIRVQAVVGLGGLAGNDDEGADGGGNSDGDHGDANEEVSGLLEKLLDVLQNDPSADVRRSLLLNLPLTPNTLPYLLERARDLDPATRRALYSRLLPALGDFRHLSLSMREKLLRWGLRDRDENVRKATANLFRERWIEDCVTPRQPTEDGKSAEVATPNVDGLLELLERIDIVNSGVEEGVAGEVMKEFWAGRPDYRDEVSFIDPFWDNLTPESVFMARTLNDFCRQKDAGKYEAVVDEKMPEVTKLAFFLQRYINNLVEKLQMNHALGESKDEDDTVEQEFIVEQLLYIAKTMDFSDEVGRRKMFALLRETLAITELPDEITKLTIDILRDVCGNDMAGEREFCGVVLEAVAEVHDAIAVCEPTEDIEGESFHSARSELSEITATESKAFHKQADDRTEEVNEAKAIREIMINMKCLHIAQCMLQNVEGTLQQNVHLVTMLNNLVVPAVRSHEAPIRERGLLCLGLCCLLDKNLAEENLTLFLHCFTKGHDALQVTAIHIIADILETHPGLLTSPNTDANVQKSILKIFAKGLKAQHVPEVQSAATTALCKLMLTSVVEDEDLLTQVVICFFDPATRENASVRQALSYFLPVYCHSRRENMERMARVADGIMHAIVDLSEELDEGDEMVGTGMVGNMLVDWTDARKLVVKDKASVSWDEAGKREVKAVNGDIHLVLADNFLRRALDHGCSSEWVYREVYRAKLTAFLGDDRKAVTGVLGKLYITSDSSAEKLQSTKQLVIEAIDNKIAGDAASRTALNKLHQALSKAVDEADKTKKDADGTATPAVEDALTTVEEEGEAAPYHGEIKADSVEDEGISQDHDSVLEELLNDEDDK